MIYMCLSIVTIFGSLPHGSHPATRPEPINQLTPAVTYGVMADRNFMVAGSKLGRRFPAREIVRRRKGKGEVVVWTAESLSRERIRRGHNGMGRRGGDGEEEEEKEDRRRKGWWWWWRRRHVESKWDDWWWENDENPAAPPNRPEKNQIPWTTWVQLAFGWF